MTQYKITEYGDGHCTVQIKEGIWPFWQKLWDYGIWLDKERTFPSRTVAQKFVDKNFLEKQVKSVTKHP